MLTANMLRPLAGAGRPSGPKGHGGPGTGRGALSAWRVDVRRADAIWGCDGRQSQSGSKQPCKTLLQVRVLINLPSDRRAAWKMTESSQRLPIKFADVWVGKNRISYCFLIFSLKGLCVLWTSQYFLCILNNIYYNLIFHNPIYVLKFSSIKHWKFLNF